MNIGISRLVRWGAVCVSCVTIAVVMIGCAQSNRMTPLPGTSASSSTYEGPAEALARTGTAPSANARRPGAGDWDELWVISRGPGRGEAVDYAYAPGCGELLTRVDDREVPLPLKHTDVRASVNGYIGSVSVRQEFDNPYDTKIEALYLFPLPHNAAVNEFIMTIGDRRIRGVIRERKEAEEIYREARSQGHVASLLTQERPNIFKQAVANIEPGRRIDVTLKYFHTLAYVDGWYEFVFPMVVGPRYNPAGTKDPIDPVARGTRARAGKAIPYLRPAERSGHDIALRLDVEAGVRIEEIACNTHELSEAPIHEERVSVSLKPHDRIPNKDFVFRYRVAGDRLKSSLLTHRDERGGFFTLMMFPPRGLERMQRAPLELVFVLDCSGSMSGKPIAQAKAAIRHALQQLEPEDSFQIINFSERASRLGRTPLEATAANIRRGLRYVDQLNSDGGTEMIEGIKAALDFPHDPSRLRFVCFLTDGFIGNEGQILGAIHEKLGDSRIFSFGVGSSPNRYLLEHMAKMGQGAVAYLGLQDDGAQVMDDFFKRISHPALTDLKIDWGSLDVSEVQPKRLPDLFVGRPITITGRFNGSQPTTIRVSGKAGRERVTMTVPARLDSGVVEALPSIWARNKIAELGDKLTYSPALTIPSTIRRTALDFGLMSSYTAFVAVDSTRRTPGHEGVTVPVAVPVPDGVRYDTTVRE